MQKGTNMLMNDKEKDKIVPKILEIYFEISFVKSRSNHHSVIAMMHLRHFPHEKKKT